jgi:hypothetical protein
MRIASGGRAALVSLVLLTPCGAARAGDSTSDQDLAEAFERCWDVAAALEADNPIEAHERMPSMVREYADPPALVRALCRSVDLYVGRKGENRGEGTVAGVLAGLLADDALRGAAIHLDAHAFVPLAAIGLILGWVYHRTRSLISCSVAHALNNLAAVVAVWLEA